MRTGRARPRGCGSLSSDLLQPGQFGIGEASGAARALVEGRAQARRLVALRQVLVVRLRLQAFTLAQPAVPVVAYGHVAHFLAQDGAEEFPRRPRTARAPVRRLLLELAR